MTTGNEKRARSIQNRIDELEQRIEILGEQEEMSRLRAPVNGNDVIAYLGITPGPMVGAIMDVLLEKRIDDLQSQWGKSQQRIDAMEERVELHLVLCAGPLPDLTAQGALVRPFEHACDVLLSRGVRRPLVIVPFDTQAAPARGKWVQSGFDPEVRSMEERPPDQPADVWLLDIGHAAVADGADALILDYVGYRKQILDAVQRGLPVPVIDLGHLATDFVRELLDEMSGLAPEA